MTRRASSLSSALGYATHGLVCHFDGIQPMRDGSAPGSTWEDLSGNGWDTVSSVGTPAWAADGFAANGLNGATGNGFRLHNKLRDDYLLLRTPSITVEALVKPLASTRPRMILFSAYVPNDVPAQYGTLQFRAQQDWRFSWNDGTGESGYNAPTTELAVSAPVYLALTSTQRRQYYYRDGVSFSTSAMSFKPVPGYGQIPLQIGVDGRATESANYRFVYMSLRFYNRVLSAAEVAANYEADKRRFGI